MNSSLWERSEYPMRAMRASMDWISQASMGEIFPQDLHWM